MTPAELKAARDRLGLSRAQMARLLDIKDARSYGRFETSRPLPVRAERLIRAYLAGHRPADWPFTTPDICDVCCGSGYSNNPDSGEVCYKCDGAGVDDHT